MRRPVPMHMKMHKIRRAIFWKLQLPAEGRVIFTLTETVSLFKHRSTWSWTTILLSLKVVIRKWCTQKWNVPSEKAIVLSPDRNKNTPIELNNANMETLALTVFSTFAARLNILMHQLALTAVTKILETGALSGAFWSRIHICLHGQKFVNELLNYSRLNLWKAKSRYKWVCSQNS